MLFKGFFIVGLITAFMAISAASAPAASPSPGQVLAAHPGELVRHGPVAVTVPPPGGMVGAQATTINGDVILRVWTEQDGSVYELSSGPMLAGGEGGNAPAECSETFQPSYVGLKWTTTMHWYFNRQSTPAENDVNNVEDDLVGATSHIINENNQCGRVDTVSATASYGGGQQQSVNIANNSACLNPDGTSLVGFGTLPTGTVAYACWWGSGGTMSESDIRFNKDTYNWITDSGSGCVTAYNVDNIATHERGHSFGLDDVNDSSHSKLTMYGYSSACQTNKETLALGDMLKLESLY
jgi:hypothetical protein